MTNFIIVFDGATEFELDFSYEAEDLPEAALGDLQFGEFGEDCMDFRFWLLLVT